MLGHIIQRMVNTVQIGSQMKKQKKAKCACLPRHFLWAGTIYSAIKSCPPWIMENAKNNTTLYIYILSISSRLRLIVNKPAHTISIFCLHIYMTFAYFVRWKRCRRHWFFKKKSDSCLFPSVLLSVGTEAALRARTKALQCGISALDIMTLRGCSGSYGRGGGEGLFLVLQLYEMSSGIWQDMKKQSPLRAPLNRTFSYIVLLL